MKKKSRKKKWHKQCTCLAFMINIIHFTVDFMNSNCMYNWNKEFPKVEMKKQRWRRDALTWPFAQWILSATSGAPTSTSATHCRLLRCFLHQLNGRTALAFLLKKFAIQLPNSDWLRLCLIPKLLCLSILGYPDEVKS